MMAGVPQQLPNGGPMGVPSDQFQTPSPEAMSFIQNLMQNGKGKHSVHVTHIAVHPAHKAKHKAIMKHKGKK